MKRFVPFGATDEQVEPVYEIAKQSLADASGEEGSWESIEMEQSRYLRDGRRQDWGWVGIVAHTDAHTIGLGYTRTHNRAGVYTHTQ